MMSRITLLVACLMSSAAASATDLQLKNPDFEKPMVGNRIPGWSRTQHAGVKAYEISTDTDSFAKGKSSIRMLRTTEQAYGLISQQVDVPGLGGKTVELTAAVKSEAVGEKGWVMVLTFKHYSDIIDQFRVPVTGDTDWKDVVISKVAPARANRIDIGFLLLDEGTGWADNVRLRVAEADEPAATDEKESGNKESPASGQKDEPADVEKVEAVVY